MVFDCWIGNADRGEESIAFSPKHEAAPLLFDHGLAPFGARAGSAARLGGCLSGRLEDGAHLYPWIQRISSLPYWCVADLCQEAEESELITPLEADAALDFLGLLL